MHDNIHNPLSKSTFNFTYQISLNENNDRNCNEAYDCWGALGSLSCKDMSNSPTLLPVGKMLLSNLNFAQKIKVKIKRKFGLNL